MPRKNRTFKVIPPSGPTDTTYFEIPEKESIPLTQQPIRFSIECCHSSCCFNKVKDQREKADFAMRLHELSQLTWGEVKQANRKYLGYETLDYIKINRSKFPPGARTIGFVYHDNHRMWGFRDKDGIFHITGFDYDGTQYKH